MQQGDDDETFNRDSCCKRVGCRDGSREGNPDLRSDGDVEGLSEGIVDGSNDRVGL